MPLMISISGIRGVIGDGLTPEVIVKYAGAFGKRANGGKIVVGRDTRPTGELISNLVIATLRSLGCSVVDVGVVPTPTVQLATEMEGAAGGIVVTASHNPIEWNALKLLSAKGQFLDADEAMQVLALADMGDYPYVAWDGTGAYSRNRTYYDEHIRQVLALDLIQPELTKARKLTVVVDAVEGAGSNIVPDLLEQMGCTVHRLHCGGTGHFPHGAEPLPENLKDLSEAVKTFKADLGMAIDPDADRLALVDEKGEPIGEEYTLVQAAKFWLGHRPGPIATNLSTTRALDDIARAAGSICHRSKVGEIHVVRKMEAVGAVIGGEGNGGVILPDVHYGRDTLVGAAITVQHLTEFGGPLSALRASLPQYEIVKRKVELDANSDPDRLIAAARAAFPEAEVNTEDGVKLDTADGWVHLRRSNTEPIIRIYAEGPTAAEADKLADRVERAFDGAKK